MADESLNDKRVSRLDAIADNADNVRGEELADFDEDAGRRSPQQGDPDDEPESQQQRMEEGQEADPHEGKRMLKVNGKELWLTDDEIMARAQKVESADEYLKSASEAVRQAAQLSLPAPADEPEADEVDVVALARALQMGTEEEAAEAVRALLKRPSLTPDDVDRRVNQRLSTNEILANARAKHAETLEHPVLAGVFQDRLNALKASAPNTGIEEAFAQIDAEMREQFAPMYAKPKTTLTKAERKAQMSSVPSAAGRQSAPEDDEPDDSPEAVIAAMAKGRGQGRAVAKLEFERTPPGGDRRNQ